LSTAKLGAVRGPDKPHGNVWEPISI